MAALQSITISVKGIQERDDNKLRSTKRQVPLREEDTNRVMVKINGNNAQALIDLQIVEGNLLNTQYTELYKILTKELEKPRTLYTSIKGSRSQINQTTLVETDLLRYKEKIKCYITNLHGEDIIIGKPTLVKNNTLIQAGPHPVIFRPEGKQKLQLTTWRKQFPQIKWLLLTIK